MLPQFPCVSISKSFCPICTIASDINSGRFNLLKWDRQEKVYYPLEINMYEKGKIDE